MSKLNRKPFSNIQALRKHEIRVVFLVKQIIEDVLQPTKRQGKIKSVRIGKMGQEKTGCISYVS